MLDAMISPGKARQWRQMNSVRPGLAKLDLKSDRTQWPILLANRFRRISSNPSLEHGMWRHRKQLECDDVAAKQLADPVLIVVFIPSDVGDAVSRLKSGETMASDRCSAEMFKAVSDEPLLALATSPSAGASGCLPAPSSWENLRAALFPKVPRLATCNDLRPVTIVPAARKCCSCVWLERVRHLLEFTLSDWNMGCRKKSQAVELIQAVRLVIERAKEWQLPPFVAKLGFRKAYGSVSHAAIEATLRQAGVDNDLVRVYVREILELNVVSHLNGISSEVVPLLMGLLQGDPASPLLFISVANSFTQPLVDRWNRENLGCKIGDERICSFAWMDDLCIFASSREDRQKMVRQTCHVTRPVGLLFQPAKCLWATYYGRFPISTFEFSI